LKIKDPDFVLPPVVLQYPLLFQPVSRKRLDFIEMYQLMQMLTLELYYGCCYIRTKRNLSQRKNSASVFFVVVKLVPYTNHVDLISTRL
jgi:hypothetical protein